jgi:hypothetical protein
MAAPIVTAYADSLSQVFLYAAVAVVGFTLALFLKQVGAIVEVKDASLDRPETRRDRGGIAASSSMRTVSPEMVPVQTHPALRG